MELFSSPEVAAGALEDTISISAEICVIAHVGVVCSQPSLLPDKTLFSQAGFEDCCVLKNSFRKAHTYILLETVYNVCCIQNINPSICDFV